MCQFFSCVSDGKGKVFYFDHKIRKQIIAGKLSYETDSHTSIADYYGFEGEKEDTLNKYEYNPLTKKFQIDQLNTTDDSEQVKQFCEKLDFKKIVPELIIKPIVHPFKDRQPKKITKKDKANLKKWASVWALVGDSVRDSVGDSVGDSVRDSVGASVGASVWASVRASVRASVGDSVRDSVWDSVWAYASSFFKLNNWKYFKHKKGQNPFRPCIDLWERGVVPAFDGKTWRLHGGKGANIMFSITSDEISKL